ncbi:LytTR family transcriptional regulator DNA-binding domain-containing protein [Alkalihalobacillus sp. CinArs1]|uniref:LytTR family transcriptional regulator DNA-binding domain-containing protein n=1 Tax=Alkalihalobacillus sp. CinArs1 TaxID=2995314 RepID=UPI0022DD709F|nr:LytTR family transcriptional regulator DNA-binding domain-containing protein [Alkalihalobacillus sp. CinArs1]
MLTIKNVEKQISDKLVLPAFDLVIEKGETVALHSNMSVISELLKGFTGRDRSFQRSIQLDGKNISKHNSDIGVSFLKGGVYERLSVLDNFKFYRGLYKSNLRIEDVLHLVQLEDKKNVKVKKLTYSEERRIQFARSLFQNPLLFVFEEPDQNVDMETKRVFLKLVTYLKQQQKCVLILTGNIESAITLADIPYRLNENGLHGLESEDDTSSEESEDEEAEPNVSPSIHFRKIPAKVEKKILLFDPTEINYLESSGGDVTIHVNGEEFQGFFSLTEYEEKLASYGYFRCHRSYLVNLEKVTEVITWTRNAYGLILEDSSELPLSKNKMATLREILGI